MYGENKEMFMDSSLIFSLSIIQKGMWHKYNLKYITQRPSECFKIAMTGSVSAFTPLNTFQGAFIF